MTTSRRTGMTTGSTGTPALRPVGRVADDVTIPLGAVISNCWGERWVYVGTNGEYVVMAREIRENCPGVPGLDGVWSTNSTAMLLREYPGVCMYLRPGVGR